jgi:hypothetical protein
MKTIKDVEAQVEEKLSGALKDLDLLPEGYRCSVRLRGKSRDKKRTASFEKNWSPDKDSLYIRFEHTSERLQATAQPAAEGKATAIPNYSTRSGPAVIDPLSDLIRALHRVESRPGFDFVALKWFRDTALPSEGLTWASSESARQAILRDAIDRRLILTSKVPNPKSPEFPVTAIRLNRLMPEVSAILGIRDQGVPEFKPVPIRGESLSGTVMRDRR